MAPLFSTASASDRSDADRSDADRAAFLESTRAWTIRWWPRLGMAVTAAALLWWPLDAILYRDSPEAVAALSRYRLQLLVLNPLLMVVLPRLAFARRHAHAAAAITGALNLALGGWALGSLATDGLPSIVYGFVAPQFSILLLVPLVPRVVIASSLALAFAGAWAAAPMNTAEGALAAPALSYFVFMTAVAVFVGHGVYRLFENNFHLHRQNERQRDALARFAASLEARVAEQTEAIQRLHARARSLRTLERREVLRNLHDSMGQELLSVSLLIGVGRQLHTEGPVAQTFAELEAQVGRMQDSLRSALRMLQPSKLDEVGLVESLSETLDELAQRAGVSLHVRADRVVEPLPHDVAVAAYHIALEAVTNALRHGHPRRVDVAMHSDARALHLTITNDGRPLDPARLGAGLGTRGIAERATELGGHTRWEDAAPGTRLSVTLPCDEAP
jgi:signal transduction histidine kinase